MLQILDFMAIVGRPLDLASLIRSSSNDSFPYFYFILLVSTLISVGVSFARILTKGKRPVIKNIVSFKFFKVILMLIFKLLVQSYILSMAVKSMMFKFVSKGRKVYKNTKGFYPFFCSTNIFPIHHMTLRVTESLRNIGTEDFAYTGPRIQSEIQHNTFAEYTKIT